MKSLTKTSSVVLAAFAASVALLTVGCKGDTYHIYPEPAPTGTPAPAPKKKPAKSDPTAIEPVKAPSTYPQ